MRAPSQMCVDHLETSTDASRGQLLAARVLARKNELEDALGALGPHDELERDAIENALAHIYALITCDLAHPSPLVARQLSSWLERNKYLADGGARA